MLLPVGWSSFAFIASLESFILATARFTKSLPHTKGKAKPSKSVFVRKVS